ncbi:nucleotide-sugar transporter-domain-containing protein [Thamnocephalis sphaerospora]|uniref:Nucleotide-sugar transporter-domain-containing protein n=1 Tax=Thamnocephalis sphaerospora TaxID=78915 RepID=A0A4P9XTU2_9FUNG|nr:nucleotide-sugar transporter-domain-containing protein [Thamnocephalis sphaerospora]|eukprot:RKP09603.1 nucleotide-sugar transporter-domain-containing protein [Thamnocephalis sphaerospora]
MTAGASVAGVSARYLSLLTLVVQNSALVLVMRYSRTMPGPRYYTSTAVVAAETIKLFCGLALYWNERRCSGFSTGLRTLSTQVFAGDAWKLAVPAMLYTIQNNIQYISVSLLDAATYQVTYQLKIITTALCAVLILQQRLAATHWLALVLLTAGVTLVQWPSSSADVTLDADEEALASTRFFGLLTVLIGCVLSGLAGVYFEKILKASKVSLWLRNVQLSLFSLPPALLCGVFMMDGDGVREHGFWYGYNVWTWTTIGLQAVGGILVAVVVKYADNILKGFATSLSIIVSCLLSVWLFDFELSVGFVLGGALVIGATFLYGSRPTWKPSQAPILPSLVEMSHSKRTTSLDAEIDAAFSDQLNEPMLRTLGGVGSKQH